MFGFGRNRRRRKAEEEALRKAAREREAAEVHRRIARHGTPMQDAQRLAERRDAMRRAAARPRTRLPKSPAAGSVVMPYGGETGCVAGDAARDNPLEISHHSPDSTPPPTTQDSPSYGGHSSSGYDGGASSGGGFDGGGGGF